jgi:hypothetical protein
MISIALPIVEAKTVNGTNNVLLDELDQYNYDTDDFGYIVYFSSEEDFTWAAQSFIPTMPTLTRAILPVWQGFSNMTCDLIISIRKDINGSDLASTSVSHNEIPGYWDEIEYIEFDFPDICVDIGETYYIVARCYCGVYDFPDDQTYAWLAKWSDVYPRGEIWGKAETSGGWNKKNNEDFCFETYGTNVEIPRLEILDITGGFRASSTIANTGRVSAIDVNWSIDLEGGFILAGGHSSGIIDEITAGAEKTIRQTTLYGIGRTTITVTVGDVTKTATGFILGPLVLGVEEIS